MGFHDILYMTYSYEKEKKTIINHIYRKKKEVRLMASALRLLVKSHLMFLINSCVFFIIYYKHLN
jgi:hypothetical protein